MYRSTTVAAYWIVGAPVHRYVVSEGRWDRPRPRVHVKLNRHFSIFSNNNAHIALLLHERVTLILVPVHARLRAPSLALLPTNVQKLRSKARTKIKLATKKLNRRVRRVVRSIQRSQKTVGYLCGGRRLTPKRREVCPTAGDAVVHGVVEPAQARRVRAPLLRHRALQVGLAVTNRRHRGAVGRAENVHLFRSAYLYMYAQDTRSMDTGRAKFERTYIHVSRGKRDVSTLKREDAAV